MSEGCNFNLEHLLHHSKKIIAQKIPATENAAKYAALDALGKRNTYQIQPQLNTIHKKSLNHRKLMYYSITPIFRSYSRFLTT